MLDPFVIYLIALVVSLGWLEASSRLFSKFGLDRENWHDLFAFFSFLVLFATLAPGTSSLVEGLLAASAILVFGSSLARRLRLGRRGLRIAELFAYLCLVQAGIAIHFIKNPSGGYLFLDGWALPVTLLWFVAFVDLLGVARAVPGLCRGILSLLSYALLAAIMIHDSGIGPDALVLAVVLAATTTTLWLHGQRRDDGKTDSIAASLWAMSLAVLPVVSTTKRIALISLATPLLLLVTPVMFFTYILIKSYLQPNLACRNGDRERWAFRWNLSLDSVLVLVMLLCLLGNLIVFSCLFASSWGWAVGLSLASAVLFWKVAGMVLLPEKRRRRQVAPDEPLDILGISFPCHRFDDAVDSVEKLISAGKPAYLVTPDALSLLRTRQDPAYRKIVQGADLRVQDGAGVVWAADVLYENPVLERIPGVELVDRLASMAERRGWKVYFLGAKPEVLPLAVEGLQKRHPALQIVGARHGYFAPEEEQEIRNEINRLQPEILLVAMGVPKQEFWIAENVGKLHCSLMIGVGGTLDVMAGTALRAPRAFRTTGLEWLYRVLMEPHRLSRILSLPGFVKEVLREKLDQSSLPQETEAGSTEEVGLGLSPDN